MKFEKFAKYAGCNGRIITMEDGEKWLFYDNIGMKIPDERQVCAVSNIKVEFLEQVLKSEKEVARLTNAVLPNPNDKASELLRVYTSNTEKSIKISNKAFSFIDDDTDMTFITSIITDKAEYKALLVTDELKSEEVKMIYIIEAWEDA